MILWEQDNLETALKTWTKTNEKCNSCTIPNFEINWLMITWDILQVSEHNNSSNTSFLFCCRQLSDPIVHSGSMNVCVPHIMLTLMEMKWTCTCRRQRKPKQRPWFWWEWVVSLCYILIYVFPAIPSMLVTEHRKSAPFSYLQYLNKMNCCNLRWRITLLLQEMESPWLPQYKTL